MAARLPVESTTKECQFAESDARSSRLQAVAACAASTLVGIAAAHGHRLVDVVRAGEPPFNAPPEIDPEMGCSFAWTETLRSATGLYLAEKSGRLLPMPLRERVPVLEWLMWQMGGFGPMPGQVHHFLGIENETDRRYGLARYSAETRRLYKVLDTRLSQREFVADTLSIADFAILGWAWRHEKHKVDLADFSHVQRWYQAMMVRPAVKRGFEISLIR